MDLAKALEAVLLAPAAGVLRERARNELSTQVRHVVETALQRGFWSVSKALREDIANTATAKAVGWLESRRVEPGKETGFVRRCARSVAVDFLRRRTREELPIEAVDAVDEAPLASEPETGEQDAAVVRHIEQVLPQMPFELRNAFVRVRLKEEPIQTLVQEEVMRRQLAGTLSGDPSPAELRRCRNYVDDRLRKALLWLRAAILAAQADGTLPGGDQ